MRWNQPEGEKTHLGNPQPFLRQMCFILHLASQRRVPLVWECAAAVVAKGTGPWSDPASKIVP